MVSIVLRIHPSPNHHRLTGSSSLNLRSDIASDIAQAVFAATS